MSYGRFLVFLYLDRVVRTVSISKLAIIKIFYLNSVQYYMTKKENAPKLVTLAFQIFLIQYRSLSARRQSSSLVIGLFCRPMITQRHVHVGAFTMSRRGRESLLVTLALCQYYYSTEKLTHEKEEAEKPLTLDTGPLNIFIFNEEGEPREGKGREAFNS
jgi:hypothetical protein